MVTGACGFIGSHLVEALVRAGARTRALTLYDARGSRGWMDDVPPDVRAGVELVAGDVRDPECVRRLVASGDIVFHLAALIGIPYSYHAPRSYVETNVLGTLNVLESARAAGAGRVIITSTSEVYGTPRRVPIAEDHPLQGQSPYAASKIGADKLAESYARSFGLPVVVVRPFNTYGPRQSARAVIPTILMQLLGARDELHLGNLHTTRDLNYVADTVQGFMRLAACDAAVGRVVNVGTGTETSIRQLVDMAQQALGRQIRVCSDTERVRPAPSEVQRLCADNTRLRTLTGWAPATTLQDGLRRAAEWMKPRIRSFDVERYYI
ncbi:MAG: GDP-mannose 4,6-dehydratase [Kiritimatiellae bacterium]|nr:GDP-mannose 4,6-dehydratase [Kiritimatiellia bacterium]